MKTKIRRGLAMLTILALIMQFTVNLSSIAVFAADEPTVAVEEQVSNEPAKTEEAAPRNEAPAPEAPKAAEQAPAPEAPKAVEQAPAPEAPKTEVKSEAPAQTESSNEVKAEAVSKEPAAEAPKTENTEANAPAETVNEIKAENAEQKAEEVNEVKNENAPAETAEAPAVNAVKAAAVSNEAAAPKTENTDEVQNSEIEEEILEEEAEEEQAEPEEEVEQGAPSAASKAAEANAGTEPRSDGKITVHYTYGLSALAKYRVDGKVTPYEYNLTMTKGQTKGQTAAGTLSFFGGKNYSFSDGGYKYTFQNTFVEGCALIQDGSISPVFTDTKDADGNPLVTESTMITKVANKGNGVVILTFADGHTKELSNIADLYLSPVYAREGGWFLDAKYIDNISTGSGSWKNEGIVSSYKKTFSNPEVKSPNLTAGKYRFEYWMNEETDEMYKAGDSFTYTGEGQKPLTTKNVEIYAYWQPAVAVRYIAEGTVAAMASSFDGDINVDAAYNGEDLSSEDYRFDGWYAGAEKADETYRLPGITKENGTYAEHDVTAFWQPAVSVAYHVLNAVETVKSFDGISVYDKAAEGDDTVVFEGWYDAEGNRLDENRIFDAPELTAKRDSAALYDVFARFATSRTVKKVWADENNADGIRAGEVTVQLYANGQPTGKTLVLSDANSWSAVFENLDAHDADGNLIEYSISEDLIPEGYTAMITVDGTEFTVTNTHKVIPAAEEETPADPEKAEPAAPKAEEPAANEPAANEPAAPAAEAATETKAAKKAAKAAANTAVAAAPAQAEAAPEVEIEGNTADAIDIEDAAAPLAAPTGNWALLNLIAAVLTAIGAVLALLRRREEDEEENEDDENEGMGRIRAAKLAGMIAAIASVITFILTEDMTQKMAMVDGWTLIMVIMLAVQIVAAALVKKACENEDDSEYEAELN